MSPYFNGSRGQVFIYSAGPCFHTACNGNHELASQLLCLCKVLCTAVTLFKYNLQDTGTVA